MGDMNGNTGNEWKHRNCGLSAVSFEVMLACVELGAHR
jgi:hypothetical protein